MKAQIDRPLGKMILADGTTYEGYLMGWSGQPVWGEVVFNTSMTGYQEVITDPSYAGQIVVMTYPQIGNYGVTLRDSERGICAARALVVHELSPFFSPGPERVSLEAFMQQQELPGLTGIDTRAVTKRIRTGGAVVAAIGSDETSDEELLNLARTKSFSAGEGLVHSVSGAPHDGIGVRTAPVERARAAVIDLGVKKSIVDSIASRGIESDVLDASFSADDVLAAGYEFVVISNGPGDPEDIPEVVSEIDNLIGKIPILGICLGQQVIALALGGTTYKLKFGHHGANQPVLDHGTRRVFITSQNHGYAVSDDLTERTGAEVTYTNASDGTMEGFVDERRMVECVQFHPEAAPGPHDTEFVFDRFIKRAKGWRDASIT